FGLPVAMYELPWLALVDGNAGIVASPQGDPAALAGRIAQLAGDPDLYASLSAGALAAAQRELTRDFPALYRQLVADRLPAELSPEPTVHDAQQLIDLVILFAEERAKAAAKERHAGVAGAGGVAGAAEEPPSSESDAGMSPLAHLVGPAARAVVDVAPWLRPLAFKARHALLRR
ncbi:MAG: hypothetical protein QM602_10340, partial [Microbacterium sp.]